MEGNISSNIQSDKSMKNKNIVISTSKEKKTQNFIPLTTKSNTSNINPIQKVSITKKFSEENLESGSKFTNSRSSMDKAEYIYSGKSLDIISNSISKKPSKQVKLPLIKEDNNKKESDEESYSVDSIELNYDTPKNLTFLLTNNIYSNNLTSYFQYPEYCKEEKKINQFTGNLKSTKVSAKDNQKNEIFLFNCNSLNNSQKEYALLYKAYKNVPNCITLPMDSNGILRTTSFLKANLIWKLLKYPKMEPLIRKLNKFQRYNHFPCTWQIGRKDNLWRNYSEFLKTYGKDHFNYLPKTYILPDDIEKFKKEVYPLFKSKQEGGAIEEEEEGVEESEKNKKKSNKSKMFIIKPVASSRGRGIKLMANIASVPNKCLVSHYIDNPLIINKKKFDLRLYVVITGFAPLKIYLFEDGLVRFASVEYNSDENNPHNKFMHLTNYSINKHNENFDSQINVGDCTGSKWSFSALKKYFFENNLDYDELFKKIKDIIIKSVITICDKTVSLTDKLTSTENCLFELYGFDVLVDSNLRPWLMEINLNPSLNTDTELDLIIKSKLMSDIFTVIGMEPYSHCHKEDQGSRKISLLKNLNLEIKQTEGLSEPFIINKKTIQLMGINSCLEVCEDEKPDKMVRNNSLITKGTKLIGKKISSSSMNVASSPTKKENLWNNINILKLDDYSKGNNMSNYKSKRDKSNFLI